MYTTHSVLLVFYIVCSIDVRSCLNNGMTPSLDVIEGSKLYAVFGYIVGCLPSTEGGQCLADLVAKALVEGPVDANLDTITASVGTSISLGMCIQFTCEYSTLHYALYSTTCSYCTCFVVTAC